MTKVTFRTVLLGGPVYCVTRGKWQPAVVITRGRTSCRVRLLHKDRYCTRRYEELAGRCLAKHGTDKPLDPAETVLSTHAAAGRTEANRTSTTSSGFLARYVLMRAPRGPSR
jgi:hypothetical protein